MLIENEVSIARFSAIAELLVVFLNSILICCINSCNRNAASKLKTYCMQ